MMIEIVTLEDGSSKIVGRDEIGRFELHHPCEGVKVLDVVTGEDIFCDYADDLRGEYRAWEKDGNGSLKVDGHGNVIPKMFKRKIKIVLPPVEMNQ